MLDKHLLIVTSIFPYPLNSGGAQAQFHMINALRKEIHISFAYMPRNLKDEKALREMWSDVTFHVYQKKRPSWLSRKYKKLITNLYRKIDRNKEVVNSALSHSFEAAIDYKFINFLQEVILENNIDIIQFEFANSLNIAFAFPDIKRIFVQHEIHFIRNSRFIKDFRSLSACNYYQFNMLKHQEIAAMNACNAIITLTDIDKNILIEEGVSSKVFVSPAVIPTPAEALPENYEFSNNLIFIGGEGHIPNYEGIMWFLDNVWDLVLVKSPDTSLSIMGQWRQRTKKKITKQYRNVIMTGYIPSITPYATNTIMIIPILTGSGMRMKIIEAANNGIPFITTGIGVEGLDFTNNEECYIESTKEKFAMKTIDLMTNKEVQLRFRGNAFNKIKEIYPTKKIINQRLDIYKQV